MDTVEQLFKDWNGGLVSLATTHCNLRAKVIKVLGTPGPDVFMLAEHGADMAFLTLYGRAYLKTYWAPRDIIEEMPRNENCPGLLVDGWWQRTLDQITGLTFHHTLSDSPHNTAKHYVASDGGRPTTPYTIWITQTGEVLLCTALEEGCWHDHTGHRNTRLSVGLAGTLHKYHPAQVQLEAAARVVKWAIEHPEMRITLDTVKGHMDVGTFKGRTECPGWNSKASGYWKDDFYALLV